MQSSDTRKGRRLHALALVAILATGGSLACGDEEEASSGPTPTMIQAPRADRSGDNGAPVVERIALHPARPAPGRQIRAAATVVDPDGDQTSVSYRWQDASGVPLGSDHLLDTRGMDQGEVIEVIAVASDGMEESEPLSHRFRLASASLEVDRVEIRSQGEQLAMMPGVRLEAVVEATDESRDYDTEIEWKVNGETVGTDDELDTTPFVPGDVVQLRVRLETDRGRSRAVSSAPVKLVRGDAPEILSKPSASLENGLYRYALKARSQLVGAKLSYQLLKGPEGMKVDERSGVVTWRPTDDQRGRFEVEVVVKDQWGSGIAQSFALQADSPQPPAAAR